MIDDKGGGVRVLVADDNPVNQKLAQQILGKLGIHAEIAGNGVEAVLAFDRARYDLILMDCHMPEMDGYETTREIRQRETGGQHTPIIALTASPFEGDRARCISAGMDGYLPKPLREADLIPVLAQWLPASSQRDPLAPSTLETLRKMPGGGEALVRELAALYLQDAPSRIEAIGLAIERRDGKALFSAAHGLKSGSANVGAAQVQDLAARLEEMGRRGDLVEAPALIEQLKREYERARQKLREIIG